MDSQFLEMCWYLCYLWYFWKCVDYLLIIAPIFYIICIQHRWTFCANLRFIGIIIINIICWSRNKRSGKCFSHTHLGVKVLVYRGSDLVFVPKSFWLTCTCIFCVNAKCFYPLVPPSNFFSGTCIKCSFSFLNHTLFTQTTKYLVYLVIYLTVNCSSPPRSWTSWTACRDSKCWNVSYRLVWKLHLL